MDIDELIAKYRHGDPMDRLAIQYDEWAFVQKCSAGPFGNRVLSSVGPFVYTNYHRGAWLRELKIARANALLTLQLITARLKE